MSGNFELIIDDEDEVRNWLRSSNKHVNDWLYELVDAVVFYAAQRLRAHAPGHIGTELVDVDLPNEHQPGAIDGAAGVEPDLRSKNFGRGLGSDPADFPFYVEVGTGRYGEHETPISTVPGSYPMAFNYQGNLIFTWHTQGQRGQHYGRRSYEDTVNWVPARIQLAKREFSAETSARAAV